MSDYQADARATPSDNGRQNDRKRRRRTKYQENGRVHICECGKSYLSYSALYTHTKSKHNYKMQQLKYGTKQGLDNTKTGSHIISTPNEKLPSVDEATGSLQIFCDYLSRVLEESQIHLENRTSINIEERNFIKMIRQYWRGVQASELVQTEGIILISIQQALGKFIQTLRQIISPSDMNFMEEFIIEIRRGLNSLKKNDDYCRTTSASKLPNLMNELFLLKLYRKDKLNFFGIYPTLVCVILYQFNRWLYDERYTNASLRLNYTQ